MRLKFDCEIQTAQVDTNTNQLLQLGFSAYFSHQKITERIIELHVQIVDLKNLSSTN